LTQSIPHVVTTPAVDDSTRYLAAAAHLDRDYAEDAVREFLVEPTRQVPPSTGADTCAILTEALAARTRRKYRDGALVVFGTIFVFFGLGTGLLGAWLTMALLISAIRIWRRSKSRGSRDVLVGLVKIAGLFFAVGASLALTTFGLLALLSVNLFDSSDSYSSYGDYSGRSGNDIAAALGTMWLVALLCALITLVIMVADRLVVWHTLTRYFGRGARRPGVVPRPPADRLSVSLSPPRFRRELDRHRAGRFASAPDAQLPLIVYRGTNPFVGAGESTTPWSMAIPLEPVPGAATKEVPLTVELLYQRVGEKMADLRESGALSPDQRLRELKIGGRVFVPAEDLLDHLHLPEAGYYLRDLDRPPEAFLRAAEAGKIHEQPREWSRYHLCLELETWDRDLVVSAFLHAAVDESTLYLEWTPCVLPPIAEVFRAVDKMVHNGLRPVGEGIVRWLLLPVTGLGRLVNACRMLLPLPYDGYQLNADRYGTGRTLRELAAMPRPRDYFQAVDAQRYVQLLESRLVPAVADVLKESGYSSVVFEQRANVIASTNVTVNGTNHGPMIFGGTSHGPISGQTGPAAPAQEKTHDRAR
jgi:hypothetical protein